MSAGTSKDRSRNSVTDQKSASKTRPRNSVVGIAAIMQDKAALASACEELAGVLADDQAPALVETILGHSKGVNHG